MMGSIIIGAALGLLMVMVSRRFFEESREIAYKRAVMSAVVLVVANMTTIKAPAVLAVLFIPIMGAAMVYLYLWWKEEGSTIKELIIFVLISWLVSVVLNNATLRVRDLTTVGWIRGIASSISVIAMLLMLGFMIADVIWFKDELTDGEFWKEKGGKENEAGRSERSKETREETANA